jgi:transposase
VPTEYSSGGSRHRRDLTKAGNVHVRAQLIEGAWQYQHRPHVGSVIAHDDRRVRRPGTSTPSAVVLAR